jgi:hypothetical protein
MSAHATGEFIAQHARILFARVALMLRFALQIGVHSAAAGGTNSTETIFFGS